MSDRENTYRTMRAFKIIAGALIPRIVTLSRMMKQVFLPRTKLRRHFLFYYADLDWAENLFYWF